MDVQTRRLEATNKFVAKLVRLGGLDAPTCPCGERTLDPDDVIRKCVLRKGHAGFHRTGVE